MRAFALDEIDRLEAVRSFVFHSEGPTPELEALAKLGQQVFGVSRAAVHIMDEDWLRIASQAGIIVQECARDIAICDRVVDSQKLLVIQDLKDHPVLSDLPYVKGEPHFRFYAGAPIELEPGIIVGTFCLLDTKPRAIETVDIQNLAQFATLGGALLRLQRANFELAASEHGLRQAAITDPLTGFYNRGGLDYIVDMRLASAAAAERPVGVLSIDMDDFKGVNDRFGHPVGDKVLKEASDRIRDCLPPDSAVIRMGGDEFVIFLDNIADLGDLQRVADDLLHAFRIVFEIDGHAVLSRLSIGGLLVTADWCERLTILAVVDEALYDAKQTGRDRAVLRRR